MYIQWFGQSCFKISTKNDNGETVIITDPLAKETGIKKNRLNADILTISIDDPKLVDTKNIKANDSQKEIFTVKGPGEYEYRSVFIYGLPTSENSNNENEGGEEEKPTPQKTNSQTDANHIYVFSIEDITIAHLGGLRQKQLTTEQLDRVEGVDILFVPVGGNYTLSASESVKLINQVEPRVVIPIHYKVPGLKANLDSVDKFIKEYSIKPEETEKLRITKKDLPQDQARLIILKP